MAKGRLSNAEKFTIEVMSHEGEKSVEEIASFLGRTQKAVKSYLETLEPTEDDNKTQFIRQTAQRGSKSVSIMTEAESSRGEMRRAKSPDKIRQRFQDTIHSIK